MQKPFQLTEAMQKELEDAAAPSNIEATHDAAGDRPRSQGLPRRPLTVQDFTGTAPRAEHDSSMDKGLGEGLPEDAINPAHYRKHPSGIECIEVTRHLNFNVGNAIKYLWRYQDKGDPVENLKKAQWYINDEITRLGGLR